MSFELSRLVMRKVSVMLRLFNLISSRWGAAAAWNVLAFAIPLLCLSIGISAGGYIGWTVGRAPLETQISNIQADYLKEGIKTAKANALELAKAQKRSDELSYQLRQSLSANDQLSKEKTRAIQTATSGRACLTDRAVRVLSTAPGLSVSSTHSMPATEQRADATSGSAPTNSSGDGLVITDTSISTWAIEAGNRYEVCRQRLDRLIDWHSPKSSRIGGHVD